MDGSPAGEPSGDWGCAALYRVRSSHQSRRSHSAALRDRTGISYEVRTKAWNCTCPAFTFAAFEYEGGGWGWESGGRSDGGVDHGKDEKNADEGRLGGLMLAEQMPVCKHLLACVLVERCVSLEEYVETRLVGREEMAGLAAGWGG